MDNFLRKLQNKSHQTMYKNQGVIYLGLFGSTARGTTHVGSDVDLLIDFGTHTKKTLFDLADIQFYLEKSLGKKVDLVTKKSLKPELQPYIEKDLITIYEQN